MGTATLTLTTNGATLSLVAGALGDVDVSQNLTNKATTVILFSSSTDLLVTAIGKANATVIGSTTNDTFDFSGATGNYTIQTGLGNDTVIDGVGNNVFDGGAGKDTFLFTAEEGSQEIDQVLNFIVGEDRIGIRNQTVLPALQQSGPDQVTITLSDGDQIVVVGAGVGLANTQDYIFLM